MEPSVDSVVYFGEKPPNGPKLPAFPAGKILPAETSIPFCHDFKMGWIDEETRRSTRQANQQRISL